MSDHTTSTPKEPSRIPEKPKQPYLNTVLFLLPLFSSAMVGLALLNLFGVNDGLTDYLKIGIVTVATFALSYSIYRLAVEKGAPLTAKGFSIAGVISVASILVVGIGMWLATYPGMVLNDVEERSLYSFENEMVRYVEDAGADAASAGRLVPVISSIRADLAAKVICEKVANCVSLTGVGGYGPVAKTLENLAARSMAVVLEASNGLTQSDEVLSELTALSATMQSTLADESRGINERRAELRQIDARIGQTLKRLEETIPVSMLSAYASELRGGISIPNSPDVSARNNGFLAGYAQSLDDVLANVRSNNAVHPVFPDRAGAIETLAYIGQYAPIAALTFAIELIFPLALWGYTLLTLLWERYRDDPDNAPKGSDPTDFERLTNKSIDSTPPPKSLPQYPPQRIKRYHNDRWG